MPGNQIQEVRDYDMLDRCRGQYFSNIAVVRIVTNNSLGSRVFDHVFDFVGGVNWGNEHHCGSDFLRSQEGDHKLHRVGKVNDYAIALLDPQASQSCGKTIHLSLRSRYENLSPRKTIAVLSGYLAHACSNRVKVYSACTGCLLVMSRNRLTSRQDCPLIHGLSFNDQSPVFQDIPVVDDRMMGRAYCSETIMEVPR